MKKKPLKRERNEKEKQYIKKFLHLNYFSKRKKKMNETYFVI